MDNSTKSSQLVGDMSFCLERIQTQQNRFRTISTDTQTNKISPLTFASFIDQLALNAVKSLEVGDLKHELSAGLAGDVLQLLNVHFVPYTDGEDGGPVTPQGRGGLHGGLDLA